VVTDYFVFVISVSVKCTHFENIWTART